VVNDGVKLQVLDLYKHMTCLLFQVIYTLYSVFDIVAAAVNQDNHTLHENKPRPLLFSSLLFSFILLVKFMIH